MRSLALWALARAVAAASNSRIAASAASLGSISACSATGAQIKNTDKRRLKRAFIATATAPSFQAVAAGPLGKEQLAPNPPIDHLQGLCLRARHTPQQARD